ncbi:MAG: branched-chain amino acid aminotransferase [Rhodospirillales bacterium]
MITPGPEGIVWRDGVWQDGNTEMMRAKAHGGWLGGMVFDGARSLDGKAPDLDRHSERAIRSAELMGLDPKITAEEIIRLSLEGIAMFPPEAELYICPMFYADTGFIVADPESTSFVLAIHESPMPPPTGFSASLTKYHRPLPDSAPTLAKASCLYPNVARGMRDARSRGFDMAVVLDPLGNLAEFSCANLFFVKDGVVHTPAINGTFLNGITRQRVMTLLRDAGVEVQERQCSYAEVLDADEVFATGNNPKVIPATRIDEREYQAGPMFRKSRELYFKFAGVKDPHM